MILNLIISIMIALIIFLVITIKKSKDIILHFIKLISFLDEELSKDSKDIDFRKIKLILRQELKIARENGIGEE